MPLSVAKNFHKLWVNSNGKNRYAHLFEQFTTRRPAYRIYIPVSSHLRINTNFSPIEIEIINALHEYAPKQYDLLDYFSGKVLKVGKPGSLGTVMNLGKVLRDLNVPLVRQAVASATNDQIMARIAKATFTVAGDGKGRVLHRYQLFDEDNMTGIPFEELTSKLDVAKLVKARDEILKLEKANDDKFIELQKKMKEEGKGAPKRKDEPIDVLAIVRKSGLSGNYLKYFAGIVSESVKAIKEGKPSVLPVKGTAISADRKSAILADAVIGSGLIWDAKLNKPRKVDKSFLESSLTWTPIDDLLNKYADDPARQDSASSAGDMAIVISRHPYDVASVSTGRAWNSCLNLGGVEPHTGRGSNACRVPASIRYGSIAVYGIKIDDANIKKPVCRVTLMPFVNEKDPDDIILDISSSSTGYGTPFPGFLRTLHMWLAAVNHGNKGGNYKIISTKPYADVGGTRAWPSFSQSRDVDSWCKKLGVTGYSVDDEGFITANGDVTINTDGLDNRFNYLPIKFKKVKGSFTMRGSSKITSLKGCPEEVGKDFNASQLGIVDLLDGPKRVGGNYIVEGCTALTTLMGFPEYVGEDFSAAQSAVGTLRGVTPSSVVEGSFDMSFTKIRRIDGFPTVNCKVTQRWRERNPSDNDPEATGCVDLSSCDVKTTVGLPDVINGDLTLRRNKYLGDMIGFPSKIVGHLTMSDCPLHDLSQINGIYIGGTFQFSDGDLCNEDVEKFKPAFIGGGIQFSSHRLTKKVKLPPNVKYGMWLGSDQDKIKYGDPDEPKVFPQPYDQRPASDIRSSEYKAKADARSAKEQAEKKLNSKSAKTKTTKK
jgi:hypothetical protein